MNGIRKQQEKNDSPLAEGRSSTTTRPDAINPCTVTTYDNKNKTILVLVVLYLCMKTRDTLESTKIHIHLYSLSCGRRGSVHVRSASTTDSNREGLNVESKMRKDKGIISRNLVLRRRYGLLLVVDGWIRGCRARPGIHRGQRGVDELKRGSFQDEGWPCQLPGVKSHVMAEVETTIR